MRIFLIFTAVGFWLYQPSVVVSESVDGSTDVSDQGSSYHSAWIDISLPRDVDVRVGELVPVTVSARNLTSGTGQGGITVSLSPDSVTAEFIPGDNMRLYEPGAKVIHQQRGCCIRTSIPMLERWISNWPRGGTEKLEFFVRPHENGDVRLLVRTAHLSKTERSRSVYPTSSLILDQQGFPAIEVYFSVVRGPEQSKERSSGERRLPTNRPDHEEMGLPKIGDVSWVFPEGFYNANGTLFHLRQIGRSNAIEIAVIEGTKKDGKIADKFVILGASPLQNIFVLQFPLKKLTPAQWQIGYQGEWPNYHFTFFEKGQCGFGVFELDYTIIREAAFRYGIILQSHNLRCVLPACQMREIFQPGTRTIKTLYSFRGSSDALLNFLNAAPNNPSIRFRKTSTWQIEVEPSEIMTLPAGCPDIDQFSLENQ